MRSSRSMKRVKPSPRKCRKTNAKTYMQVGKKQLQQHKCLNTNKTTIKGEMEHGFFTPDKKTGNPTNESRTTRSADHRRWDHRGRCRTASQCCRDENRFDRYAGLC